MHEAISEMLKRYQCVSRADYHNALKEIIQELALFGLWRHKFFEHAAFYGGTALRILYGLNRFSEDLDFSLLQTNPHFKLNDYEEGIRRELEAFGFVLEVEVKEKSVETAIQSAFLKGNTMIHLLKIGMPQTHTKYFHPDEKVKIKLEIDTDPPQKFETEAVAIFLPLPFSVRTYKLPDLFAGKVSALLFRKWKKRVKGRDWYDFLWFVSRKVPLNINYLHARMVQAEVSFTKKQITLEDVKELIRQRVEDLDLGLAKRDVMPFIKEPRDLEGWSKGLFYAAIEQLTY